MHQDITILPCSPMLIPENPISSLVENGRLLMEYKLLMLPRVLCKHITFLAHHILTWEDSYFTAAHPMPTERNLYFVSIPESIGALSEGKVEMKSLTFSAEPSHYVTSFSPRAGFYLLSYEGPNIPWQRVVKADDASTFELPLTHAQQSSDHLAAFDYLLTDNAWLNQTWAQYETPVVSYSTIQSDGYGMI